MHTANHPSSWETTESCTHLQRTWRHHQLSPQQPSGLRTFSITCVLSPYCEHLLSPAGLWASSAGAKAALSSRANPKCFQNKCIHEEAAAMQDHSIAECGNKRSPCHPPIPSLQDSVFPFNGYITICNNQEGTSTNQSEQKQACSEAGSWATAQHQVPGASGSKGETGQGKICLVSSEEHQFIHQRGNVNISTCARPTAWWSYSG